MKARSTIGVLSWLPLKVAVQRWLLQSRTENNETRENVRNWRKFPGAGALSPYAAVAGEFAPGSKQPKLEMWNFANDILRRLLFLPLSLVLNGNLKQSETTTPPLDHNDNHVSSLGKSSWANASTNSRKGCCASDERGDPIFSPKKLSNGLAINLSSKTFDCLTSRSWI